MQFPKEILLVIPIFFLTETMTVSILDSLHMVDTGDSYDNDDNVKYIVSHTKDLFIFFLVV